MKILHVISMMDTAAGGPTRAVAELAKYQAMTGDQVTVCTTDRGIEPHTRIGRDVTQRLLGANVQVEAFSVEFHPMLVSRSLVSWIKRRIGEFEIVHVHGLYRFPSTYASFRARQRRIPYVISPHGALDLYLHKRSAKSVFLKRLYEHLFELRNLAGAGALHFTAVDERTRSAFVPEKSFVVPIGIDWERFCILPRRGKLREMLGLTDEPLVLFLGRLNFKKGLDLLIDAFHRLRARVPSAKLAIVGPDSDSYERKVRKWVSDRELNSAVEFVGVREGQEVVEAYVDADVFVLPSYTENFGISIVEAMACGTPVVISDQVNIHREIASSGAGVVTRCDAKELEEAIHALLCDEKRRSRMGALGRETAKVKYAWPEVVTSMRREYQKVIDDTPTFDLLAHS